MKLYEFNVIELKVLHLKKVHCQQRAQDISFLNSKWQKPATYSIYCTPDMCLKQHYTKQLTIWYENKPHSSFSGAVVWTFNTSAPSLGSEEEFNSQKNSFLQNYKLLNVYWKHVHSNSTQTIKSGITDSQQVTNTINSNMSRKSF